MKNITALTILVISLFIFINSAYSQSEEDEKKYGFFISTQSGFVYGKALELVYPLPGQTNNELLSELIWDINSVFYLGVQAQFSLVDLTSAPGFFSSLSFKAGIPARSGIMEDRDWLMPSSGELTHFSSHTNKTRQFFIADAVVGFTLPVKNFYFKPFISFSWMHFSFTGSDGYGLYPSGNVSFSGKEVIRYKQDWLLLLSPGLSAGVKVFSRLTFDLSFNISPHTYCADVDEHLLTDTKYMDFTTWGLYIEPSFSAAYSVKRTDFVLDFTYRRIGNTNGKTYITEKNNEPQLSSNKAGAGLSLFDTRFLIRIRLF